MIKMLTRNRYFSRKFYNFITLLEANLLMIKKDELQIFYYDNKANSSVVLDFLI